MLRWTYTGLQPYDVMWRYQEGLRDQLLHGTGENLLVLTEHPPTISMGRAEKGANLLFDRADLTAKGFDLVETNRGGKVTYHGPGQLVAYPVIDLRTFRLGIKQYVCLLEKTMIETLASVGITAHRQDSYPGAWVGKQKIGSVGIHVRKQISIHGIALNVNTNLKHFDVITPCGIPNIQMTSMEREGVELSVEQVCSLFVRSFSKIFACELEPVLSPEIGSVFRSHRDSQPALHV